MGSLVVVGIHKVNSQLNGVMIPENVLLNGKWIHTVLMQLAQLLCVIPSWIYHAIVVCFPFSSLSESDSCCDD